MTDSPELRAHKQWLGYVQPVGLVVSPHALLGAQAQVKQNVIAEHRAFIDAITVTPSDDGGTETAAITDLPHFAQRVLGWEPADLLGAPGAEPLPSSLEVVLTEYQETLRPTYAVRDLPSAGGGEPPWLLLVQELPLGQPLDDVTETDEHRWQASPQARFERLLRETQVPIGLMSNGAELRLVYAPRGETSGHLTFVVGDMRSVAGRPIFAALHMLLSAERLFTLPDGQRLPDILAASRRHQNVVSKKLAEQVLAALYELLRGFQAADDARRGSLLRELLHDAPEEVYGGLLTVLLRLVFVLYAEDRGLLPRAAFFADHYAITGLFERLRIDAGRHPDTMDQRYGAWAQLLALFRLVHDGARHGDVRLPARRGHLFDPDRYPFLEGRPRGSTRQPGERLDPPLVSDGVVHRVLEQLLVLDGERLSYRTLDVEEIGSVYQAIMGFTLDVASGRSIAVRSKKAHGAPTTIDLDALLAVPAAGRARWLKEASEQDLTGKGAEALKAARTVEDLVAALGRKVAAHATPQIVAKGAMILQPSDERRRSGSHYTPRSLTEPIVRTTLRPVLERLGERPTPEQILDLKVCDLAMGSGAFLVEACRQLSETLVKAWHDHDRVPAIPPDEDELLAARRRIAQRCVYGVDKNPLATDLAKLSLWLATLARDHPFTFLDHTLRSGDSLVGLTREQLADFHWRDEPGRVFGQERLEKLVDTATRYRAEILDADEELVPPEHKRAKLAQADDALTFVRLAGDAVIAAFFSADTDKKREARRQELLAAVTENPPTLEGVRTVDAAVAELRSGARPVTPFHWEIEFPEVFERENSGFDAVVGNPPFASKNTLTRSSRSGYIGWLGVLHRESHGNADLVAHFFRRSFDVLGNGGCFGLIATNTIGQGDTRSTGLRWLCTHGGTIYSATRRLRWPGSAAVVVSVVYVCRGLYCDTRLLDGRPVEQITAFLFHLGDSSDPNPLRSNAGLAREGVKWRGEGFVLDWNEGARMITASPALSAVLRPLLNGEQLKSDPTQSPCSMIIDLGEKTLEECRAWPEALLLVQDRVRPEREQLRKAGDQRLREQWWIFERPRTDFLQQLRREAECLAVGATGTWHTVVRVPTAHDYSNAVVLFRLRSSADFAVMQSQSHEHWARFFGSSMKDDPRYTPTDCFETFPFPSDYESNVAIENTGRSYYEFRAAMMIRNDEGLTKTYNRFHDPGHDGTGVAGRDPSDVVRDIERLRELHAAMDRAVLDAYGWTDIPTACEFILDYEDENDDEDGRASRRKKPWRYRWPDEVRDEVLARLLALNAERAEQERLAGDGPPRGTTDRRRQGKRTSTRPTLPFGSRRAEGR